VGGIGIGHIIAMCGIFIQVQIDEVDWNIRLQARPDGLRERVCGFNGEIEGFALVILVQDDGDLRESAHSLFDHILNGAGQFYGYGIRPNAVK
jgi:hypothetical protein